MTTTQNRTAAVSRNGQPIYVGEGAQRQDGSLKLYTCTTCGNEVVWATSTRTGRRYLVNVSRGASEARYYVKANAHDCAAVTDARSQAIAIDEAHAAYMDAFLAFQADIKSGALIAHTPECSARLDHLDTLSDAETAAKAGA